MKFLKNLWDTFQGGSKHDARMGALLSPEQQRMNAMLEARAMGTGGPTAAEAVHARKMAEAQRAISARAASARGSSSPLAAREAVRQQAEMSGEAAATAAELRAQEQQAYAALATGQYAEQQRQRMQAEAINAQTQSDNAARAQFGIGTAAAALSSFMSDVREKTDVRPVRDYRRLAREAAEASSAIARSTEEEPPAPRPPPAAPTTRVLPEVQRALARRAPEPPPRPIPQWLRDEARAQGWDQPADAPTEERAQDAPGWQDRGIEVLMRSAADKEGGLEAANAWNWRYKRRARERAGLPPDDGERIGPMAQELARSRIGRKAVVRDPTTGRLALDRDRALQLALGAAAAAHRRLDEQED